MTTPLEMDPTLQWTLRACVALLLGSAAWHKLADPAAFRRALAGYELLPVAAVAPAAAAVVTIEAVLAAALAASFLVAPAAIAAAALMVFYALAMAVNLRRGRSDIDCGCMGPAAHVPLSPALVARNLVVAGSCAVLVLPASSRALSLLDLFVVGAATSVMAACWIATQRLLALAPRAAMLRSTHR